MKIRHLENPDPPFDVPAGLGNWLISRGEFEKYTPAAPPQRIFDTVWQVKTSARNDSGTTLPPFIAARCSCSATLHYEGTNPGGAVLLHHASCTGQQELPPAEVCAEYLAQRKLHYKNWKPAPAGIDILAERRRNPEFFLVEVNKHE